uniref:Cyclic nucleotide-binding domain-containing protein n=1 Tax=Kalanchoe fedtschenkoi TaxID=63787 RepID=A0A7N0RBH2_KALFE
MKWRGSPKDDDRGYDIEDTSVRRRWTAKSRNLSRSMSFYSVGCCVLAVSLDPLFFYIPVLDRQQNCLGLDRKMGVVACALRSIFDILYIAHIIFQLYVMDYFGSFSRYFRIGLYYIFRDPAVMKHTVFLIVDILAVLPLPQMVIAFMFPNVLGAKNALKWVIFCQYLFRFLRIYPLYQQVKRTSGTFFENARAGAALNLLLYMLASHLVGSFWYLFSIERVNTCWTEACQAPHCNADYLYCHRRQRRNNLFLDAACPLTEQLMSAQNSTASFDFGIFSNALKSGVLESRNFGKKFLYCFWWSLRSLSSLGQNLDTSSFELEICFAISIAILGLILFALIISNIQNYLQSSNVRVEEMRVRKQDREWWMSHRRLPENLRERIRRYEQYKWQETRGLVEDTMYMSLPKYLRRDVKRHIGLLLLFRVPLFDQIRDDLFLEAICAHLKPVLYTEGSLVLCEGDPVDEMLFVVGGTLDSVSTSGGRSGFFNVVHLREGDFCGEELLTWALNPKSIAGRPPKSTRTVRALSEVEVFALVADDLRSVASQNPQIYSQQFRHAFRFYSHQWRMWAACYIQAAWRRYYKRKLENSLTLVETEDSQLQLGRSQEWTLELDTS